MENSFPVNGSQKITYIRQIDSVKMGIRDKEGYYIKVKRYNHGKIKKYI